MYLDLVLQTSDCTCSYLPRSEYNLLSSAD